MRQLLSILPPRMVSRKWTSQPSSGQTLRSAAAIPPLGHDRVGLAEERLADDGRPHPWLAASIAARDRPAGADHDDVVFVDLVRFELAHWATSLSEDDAEVPDDAHRHQPDVEVGEAHAEEREPGEGRVPLVEPRDDLPQRAAGRSLRELVERPAAEVAAARARNV